MPRVLIKSLAVSSGEATLKSDHGAYVCPKKNEYAALRWGPRNTVSSSRVVKLAIKIEIAKDHPLKTITSVPTFFLCVFQLSLVSPSPPLLANCDDIRAYYTASPSFMYDIVLRVSLPNTQASAGACFENRRLQHAPPAPDAKRNPSNAVDRRYRVDKTDCVVSLIVKGERRATRLGLHSYGPWPFVNTMHPELSLLRH